MQEPMVFESLEPIEVEVRVGDKTYTLREANESAAVLWRDAQLKASRMHDGKLVSFEGMAATEPLLVSLCMYEGEKQVPIQVVRSWPARLVKQLHERIMLISDLEEKPKTAEATKKAIATLQEHLNKLEAGDNAPKEQQSSGTDTSSSAQS